MLRHDQRREYDAVFWRGEPERFEARVLLELHPAEPMLRNPVRGNGRCSDVG